ncbi:tRNA (adenosine(37)-N6)-threonylcarbamoyltransferase complex ATPase subunit type 1 TsaE [bacterium]|nr:tRNA (adenosine(37)-N6)-threonylcarbamoyltransferase complex ATPase subunit type 1 TsaE [FCB group bacterium]MBL7192321.1 tRNA (adenosine(37)-N6)-threonylcarbamoyltransferase complex ATPase subunit type 1 TsaE [bacterium]
MKSDLPKITRNPAETQELGNRFSENLSAGDVVFIIGELGAGKTVFVKGIAAGLGIRENITSPSFNLVKTYQGRCTLNHYDFYRLNPGDDLSELNVEALQDDDSICVIEWGERFAILHTTPRWEVRIKYSDSDIERLIEIERIAG